MRILVAGIGNIFFGDDGFGVEVADRLVAQPWPDGVEVEEYGIRGVHLAYQLLEGYDVLVLVDAVPMGDDPPGTIAIIEPDLVAIAEAVADAGDGAAPAMDAHTMNPAMVLRMLASMRGEIGRVLVVGCQPAVIEDGIGLSPPVRAAVDPAVAAVESLVAELLADPTEQLAENPSPKQESPA